MADDKFIYLQGKSKFARNLISVDNFDKYSVSLCSMTPASYDLISALNVRNIIKKDEDGYSVKLSCPRSKMMKGKPVFFEPPTIIDTDGITKKDLIIGDGSDITCKVQVYTYKPPGEQERKNAIRLASVRVDNLVPFLRERDLEGYDLQVAEDWQKKAPAPLSF